MNVRWLTSTALASLCVLAGGLLLWSAPALAVTPPVVEGGSVLNAQSSGSEFALPDGRQYELVSPPSSNGALIETIGYGDVVEAAEDGGAITYVTRGVLGSDPEGSVLEGTQVLSTRGTDGWSSQDIATPREAPSGVTVGEGAEYEFFSSDLSLGLITELGRDEMLLAPEVSERTVYLREHLLGGGGASYEPLATDGNTSPGSKYASLQFLSATPDLSHIVLGSEEVLTPNAIRNIYDPTNESLYEWTGGRLQLVSVMPNGRPATEPEPQEPEEAFSSSLGALNTDVRHAISNDGSRVVWETAGVHHLYMRDMSKGETVQLDAAQGVSELDYGAARFQTASNDGSKVFFTDRQSLTANSTANEGTNAADLYECEMVEVAGKLACKLADLTVDQNPGESADVLGVLPGVSEDGSYVYFIAGGVLAKGAISGGNNLYVLHDIGGEWKTTFIAALSSDDGPDWGATAENLGKVTSRVSPSGNYLAFMSDESLTGYDNTDVNSGQPDEEVFVYDAVHGSVICASCNPTGARPAGVFDSFGGVKASPLLIDERGIWGSQWLAGSIPGWTSVDTGFALYQSRYLSDSGRLFFDSADALVPQDSDGVEDVYEYEPAGVGGCEASGVTFSETSGGCVGLISPGTSGEESAFLDASASGDDVFFLTTSRLVTQDNDNSYHAYDAHVCSEAVPCPIQLASSPPCTTSDACEPPPPPQPAVFGAPASATFSGSGNVAPAQAQVEAPKPLTRARARKLINSLKACKAKSKKRKRAACERKAREAYGARASRTNGVSSTTRRDRRAG